MIVALVTCRAASKTVPNRLVFSDSFDRAGGSRAFSFHKKQSPSLERGWAQRLGSCEQTGCLAAEGTFVKASAFCLPLFGSGSTGLENAKGTGSLK